MILEKQAGVCWAGWQHSPQCRRGRKGDLRGHGGEDPLGSWQRLQGIFKDHFFFHSGLESWQLQGDENSPQACLPMVMVLPGTCGSWQEPAAGSGPSLLSCSKGHSSLQILGIPGFLILGIGCSITWVCSNTSMILCTFFLCMRHGSCLQSAHMAPVDWEPSKYTKSVA